MDQLHSNHVVVFPNPFTEVLNVFIPKSKLSDDTKIFVSDELNRIIASYSIDNETTSLMLGELAKGVYFISVYSDGKVVQTERVIK